MSIKREVLATATTSDELLEPQKRKAEELNLLPPQQDQRNNWGPIFANSAYDLRIDKKTGIEQYELSLLHKAQIGGVFDHFRKR